jgi:putative endonuclease
MEKLTPHIGYSNESYIDFQKNGPLEMNENNWVVYLVRCSDKSLYCGITNDIKKRLSEHNSGKGAKYTKSRIPVELVAVSPEMTKSDALKLEYRVKQQPAQEKIDELSKEP